MSDGSSETAKADGPFDGAPKTIFSFQLALDAVDLSHLTEQAVRLEGLDRPMNLRSMGGYPVARTGDETVADGVTAAVAYRSGQLAIHPAEVIRWIEQNGPTRIVDLRTESEHIGDVVAVEALRAAGMQVLLIPIETDETVLTESYIKEHNMKKYDTYYFYYSNEVAQLGTRDVMIQIADALESGELVIWHCRSGKDRTGFIAALYARLLGVPTDLVGFDYSLTDTGPASEHQVEYFSQPVQDFRGEGAPLSHAEETIVRAGVALIRQHNYEALGEMLKHGPTQRAMDMATMVLNNVDERPFTINGRMLVAETFFAGYWRKGQFDNIADVFIHNQQSLYSRADVMVRMIETIEAEHGSVEQYLLDIGVPQDRIDVIKAKGVIDLPEPVSLSGPGY